MNPFVRWCRPPRILPALRMYSLAVDPTMRRDAARASDVLFSPLFLEPVHACTG
jgi:hypothetical protein